MTGASTKAPPRALASAAPADAWWREAWAVAVKDVRSELRTRAAVATILLFAVVTLMVVAFAVPTRGPGLTMLDGRNVPEGTFGRAALLSALLWTILFFSAMVGLPRVFVKEEEMRTAAALRLAARPGAVLAGKLLFNVALTLAVAAVVVPLWLVLFEPWIRNPASLLAHLAAGTLGMAGSATILGAIVARAGGRAYLMLPLAFPILLPILVLCINGTAAALHGKGGNLLVPLVSYIVAMTTLSALLFERVWSDA